MTTELETLMQQAIQSAKGNYPVHDAESLTKIVKDLANCRRQSDVLDILDNITAAELMGWLIEVQARRLLGTGFVKDLDTSFLKPSLGDVFTFDDGSSPESFYVSNKPSFGDISIYGKERMTWEDVTGPDLTNVVYFSKIKKKKDSTPWGGRL